MPPIRPEHTDHDALAARCFRLGWWGLIIAVLGGLILETLHAFRVSFYLGVGADTRRLMWTLAHAHGALLSLVLIAFAAYFGSSVGRANRAPYPRIARLLIAGWVLLPTGFFLGGVWLVENDPSFAIVLAPIGAVLLLAGLTPLALSVAAPKPGREGEESSSNPHSGKRRGR